MATKSNRSKDNITKNIFIKTLLFCILLSLCLYQIIYFLASNYDKDRLRASGTQTAEQAESDKQNDQSKTKQNKAVSESSISNFQSSQIDMNTLSTAINHLLQPSQTAKAKEHAQNIPGKVTQRLHLQKRKSKLLTMMPYIHKMQQVKQMIHMIIHR